MLSVELLDSDDFHILIVNPWMVFAPFCLVVSHDIVDYDGFGYQVVLGGEHKIWRLACFFTD